MEIDKIPPMKPVLVESISDDISTLQRDDVTQQKTVLTARAIEDIFKCAPIRTTNATDVDYFVDNKVDLDKIVTACSRTIDADQYIHGPELKFDDITDTEHPEWSANHTTKVLVPHAFIYTFSVLDDSTLSWTNYKDDISIDDAHDTETPNYRAVDAREPSPKIRQIYVPNVPNEYYPNRPSDELNAKYRSRQDLGSAWTRYGSLQSDGTYVWERWFKMGRTHFGAEYFNQIIVADNATIENPLYDSVYHVYGPVPSITLPNANLDGYHPGMKIIVEVHPPRSTDVASSCRVLYTDTNNVGTTIRDMNIYITPKVRRNTKDIFGNVRDDVQTTSVACFEIVEVKEGDQTFRTWELDGGVEESDFIAGLAQMLGEHIDPATGDIVQYQRESIKTLKTLDILYPVTSSGFVMARFLKHQEIASEKWKAYVEILNPTSDADFSLVDSSTEPNPALVYYIRTGTTMALAENNGHPEIFASTNEYYSLNETCTKTSVINFVPEGSATVRTDIGLSDLTLDEWRGFSAYVNRNCVIHIKIVSADTSSSQSIETFQGSVYPIVLFFPDQHDSYIQKGAMNPSAYTWYQLEKLFKNGGIINDKSLALCAFDESLANAPASTRSLIDAYTYIATKLQMKGLFLGNRYEGNLEEDGFDRLIGPGTYYIVPKYDYCAGCTYPPNLTKDGCNLFVLTNGHAPSGSVHEEEGGIVDPSRIIQVAILAGSPAEGYSRIGIKQTDGTWLWGDWFKIFDWERQLYYHSRWDYFEDPDKILNHIDEDTVTIVHNEESLHCEVQTNITEEQISTIMVPSSDPAWDTNVNYDMPQFMVGIDQLTTDAWKAEKLVTETGIDYVINVRLPAAVASELETTDKTRRRKVRFLFFGNPTTDWSQVLFRLSFASSIEGQGDYTYERNWGGKSKSIIVLEFEQMDIPSGERVWSPHEVG